MPQFSPGQAKIAIAPIVAKPSGMDCEAELFLGPDDLTKVASSGRILFVSTGAAKNVSLPIAMPSEGTYHGYIDVFAEGMRFLAYKAKEDVIVAIPPAFAFSNISAVMVGCTGAPAWNTMNFDCLITNPTSQTLTRTIKIMRKYYADSKPGVIQYEGELPSMLRIALTLNPGESYQYNFEGNYYDPSDGMWYAWLVIARYTTHCLWLEDEDGNKSPEACVHRG